MFAGTKHLNRGKGLLGSALLVVGIAACLACATTPVTPVASGSSALSDVVVESEGGATVVSLLGLTDPVYNAFQQDDPARVVIDLAAVSPGGVAPATAVYDGTVEEVTVAGFDTDGTGSTRVELTLSVGSSYEITALADRLEVRIVAEASAGDLATGDTATDDETAAEAAPTGDPWALAVEAETDTTEIMSDPSESGSAVVAEVFKATVLRGVSTDAEAGALSTMLEADGAIEGATWFTLEDPTRLVVDLPGLGSELSTPQVDVGSEWVSRVRVGAHEDKVRVVLDGTEAADFSTVQLVTIPDGLWVGLGSATAPASVDTSSETVPVARETEAGDDVVADEPAASDEEVASEPEASDEEIVAGVLADADALEVAEVEVLEIADATSSVDAAPAEIAADDEETAANAADEVETAIDTTEVAETQTAEVIEVAETQTAEVIEVAETEAPVIEIVEDVEATETETAAVWTEESVDAEVEEAGAETLSVYGVQLETEGGGERVIIVSEGPAEFVTTSPAPDTTVVSLKGATIDSDATVRIAPENPGVVSLVTAFQQPEASTPEVRVVVRGPIGTKPTVHQEGGLLFLDFPASVKLSESLPMMSDEAGEEAAAPAALDPSSDSVEILLEGGLVNGKTYTGRRISLDFKDVEIDDVLRLIAEVSDLNIIAGDEVNGKVTIRLVDVPWDQALDVILLTRGLGFVRVGSVLRIAPSNLLKAEEEARLQERRAKEKLEDLVVKLQPVNYADVEEIEKMVKRLLTPRGSVDVDERTNTVILKDIASVIDEATALIKAIDTQTPQVMIEAKIVEANLDFGKEVGTVWGFGVQPFNDAFDDTSGPARRDFGAKDFIFSDDFSLLPGGQGVNTNNITVANPITSTPTGLLNLGAFILDERFNLEAQIQAAESYGEGKVISSPRIVTLDNRKASIEQGVSIPFQTFENGDAKLEFIDAVLRLDVTPHITADKSIIMKLEVQRNAPDDSVQTPTGSPAIAKNEAETETLVKDGQTLVIGGIYVVNQSERESRVPYFHKIPLLGNAFRNDEVRDIRKELLVFVTPRIVVNPELGS